MTALTFPLFCYKVHQAKPAPPRPVLATMVERVTSLHTREPPEAVGLPVKRLASVGGTPSPWAALFSVPLLLLS